MSERQQPLVIAGFGRSGTTWLQDALATANHLRAVFEPLNPDAVQGSRAHAYRFVNPDSEEPDLYRFLHHFFFEEFRSLWADSRIVKQKLIVRPGDLASWESSRRVLRQYGRAFDYLKRYRKQRQNGRRIVKFVRANMMLSWLKRAFDAKVVFIVRHPAAVVTSQLRSPASWNPYARIEQFRNDSALLETLDDRSRALLFRPCEDIETCTLLWCIENQEALRQARESKIHVVYYEDLVRDGARRWREITAVLGLDIVPQAELVARPSQQTWGQPTDDPALVRRYAAWKERIDGASARRIQATLDAARVDFYSIDDALPINREAHVR